MKIAEDVCAALRSCNIPHGANSPGIVTVSIGCSTIVPQLGEQALTLIEAADAALYTAKRAGRNQVCNGNSINAG